MNTALDMKAKLVAQLRHAADEMRAEDQKGWPVLCDIVADYLSALSPSQGEGAPAPERAVDGRCEYCKENGFQHPNLCEDCRSAVAAEPGETVAATEITMGRGLVDVTCISHEGRSGILFHPRDRHIPVGEPGDLPAGTYWPVSGDVVIWIENEGGAQVIQKHIAEFLAHPLPLKEEVERVAYLHEHPKHGKELDFQSLTVADKKYGYRETPLYAHPAHPLLLRDEIMRAVNRVLKWVAPIAGDNMMDAEAAKEEEESVEALCALLSPLRAETQEEWRQKIEEIRARVERTICPTFSSDVGDMGEQGRISREDFDTLIISILGRLDRIAKGRVYGGTAAEAKDLIEALQKELAERTAERDANPRWKKKAVELGADLLAAEARADTLARRVEGLEAALQASKKRFVRIENIIARNLGRQDEKVEDARSIATEGWCSIDAALTGERP